MVSEANQRRSRWERAASVATVFGAVFAVVALWLSYWTFQRQTYIQANQAAHNATQAHLQLRVEHSDIIRIEDQISRSQGGLEKLDRDDYDLYVTISEDGIAMAEYVYKLWRGDPGWDDTVESWIVTYRPYLLSVELDCGDWDPRFVQFVSDSLGTSSDDFCFDGGVETSVAPFPFGVVAVVMVLIVVIALGALRMFASRRG